MISTTQSAAASSSPASYSSNKIQDERDMAMLKSEDQKIFSVERYMCKSEAFVANVNKFGEAGGFESLLKMLSKADVSLESVFQIVSFFVKSHAMYHKQFVDDFYDRFSEALEAKLLSATTA